MKITLKRFSSPKASEEEKRRKKEERLIDRKSDNVASTTAVVALPALGIPTAINIANKQKKDEDRLLKSYESLREKIKEDYKNNKKKIFDTESKVADILDKKYKNDPLKKIYQKHRLAEVASKYRLNNIDNKLKRDTSAVLHYTKGLKILDKRLAKRMVKGGSIVLGGSLLSALAGKKISKNILSKERKNNLDKK